MPEPLRELADEHVVGRSAPWKKQRRGKVSSAALHPVHMSRAEEK
jgi:hypothetical protein